MKNCSFILLSTLLIVLSSTTISRDRGEVATYKNKFVWSESGVAFVPNYVMIDMLSGNLSSIEEKSFDQFITTFFGEHGFNGVHVPVYGQWFHIGDSKVSRQDSVIDQRTFDQLKMIINKVYKAGGSTHLWLWGDHSRNQTSNSLADGIMGKQEKMLLDEIHRQLNPLKGWTMGYGYDLWEWVSEDQLKNWHTYLWQKDGWNHLLGARASKNKLDQLYEGLDYAAYEYHKPSYKELLTMINKRPEKPSFSEDRYRIRTPSKYPEKDYNEEETRRGLWYHTMAGGVAAIWGNFDGDGEYTNKETLKCFSVFWNDKNRFKKDMEVDNNLTDGYCLVQNTTHYVFYKVDTDVVRYSFSGKQKNVIAVDTKKKYAELKIGSQKAGSHTFNAPYVSDWAIAVE